MNLRLVASRTLLIGSVALACVTGTRWAPHSPTSMALESVGLAMLLFGAFGRVWCAVHIAGRKNKDLVAVGPFSTMRNPLYFFSMFAFTGAGLCFDSISLGALFLGVFLLTHWPTILSEETDVNKLHDLVTDLDLHQKHSKVSMYNSNSDSKENSHPLLIFLLNHHLNYYNSHHIHYNLKLNQQLQQLHLHESLNHK
jgi:isoprenylcysteine carboxyl methyltransferase (ICMT) family protein YpbQ